jgi:hypothetical protein
VVDPGLVTDPRSVEVVRVNAERAYLAADDYDIVELA